MFFTDLKRFYEWMFCNNIRPINMWKDDNISIDLQNVSAHNVSLQNVHNVSPTKGISCVVIRFVGRQINLSKLNV